MIYLQLFRDYGERQTHSDPIHRNEVAAFCRPASERRNWNDFVKPRALADYLGGPGFVREVGLNIGAP